MDVESILIKAGIDFDKKGERLWVQCAEHNDSDRKNSYIYASSGLYWCYTCHATGNIKKFLEVRGKSLSNYLSKDESLTTTEYKKQTRDLSSVEIRLIKGKIEDVYTNMEAYAYCKSLGMTDKFIDTYEISYTKYAQFIANDCIDTRKPTTFFKRILFPVYENNKLVSVGGRDYTLKQTPKELYPCGAITTQPYNYDNLNIHMPVVWNEGWKNFCSIYPVYSNACSNFGSYSYKGKPNDSTTWEVIPKTKKLLEIPELVLFLDNDKAGIEYAITYNTMHELYGKGKVKYVQDTRTHTTGKGYDAFDCSYEEKKELLHIKQNGDIDFNSLDSFDEWYNKSEIESLYSKKDYDSFL